MVPALEARVAPGQGIRPDEHNCPGSGQVKWITNTYGMTEKDIALQFCHLFQRNNAFFESAKTGGNAVGHLASGQ